MALVEVRPAAGAGGLRAGMFCEVAIPVARREAAVLIPPQALRREAAAYAVYVMEGNVMRRRPVSVGAAREDAVEITAGVAAGDEVVVFANRDAEDGLKVVRKTRYRPHR